MKKIVLLCNMGMSTSMMVSKMKDAAKKQGFECEISAYSIKELDEVKKYADCILIGPQIRFELDNIKLQCPDIPAKDISMMDYGIMNGEKVLEMAIEMMNN